MIQLLSGIVARMRTSVFCQGMFPGGVFHGRTRGAPSMFPYCRIVFLAAPESEHDTGKNTIDTPSIQFHSYGHSDEEVDACNEAIRKEFVQQNSIIWSGGSAFSFTKGSQEVEEDPDLDVDGETIWCGHLQLDLFVQT